MRDWFSWIVGSVLGVCLVGLVYGWVSYSKKIQSEAQDDVYEICRQQFMEETHCFEDNSAATCLERIEKKCGK